MKPLYFIFGLLVGVCAGVAVFLVGAELVISSSIEYAAILSAALVAIAVGGFLGFFVLRYIMIKKLGISTSPTAGSLVDRVFNLTDPSRNLPVQARHEEARQLVKGGAVWFASSLGFYSLLNSIVAVVAIFAGTVASLLLFKQNELISEQKKSDLLQAVLAESARRSTQFSFANELVARLKVAPLEVGPNGFRRVDEELRQEIEQTLLRLQPYAVADFDPETFRIDRDVQESVDVSFLSPEKGQILRSLIEQNVNIGGNLGSVNFSSSDYRDYPAVATYPPYDCTGREPLDWMVSEDLRDLSSIEMGRSDFSRSHLTKALIDLDEQTAAHGTVFESSVVRLSGIPEGHIILNGSLLVFDIEGPEELGRFKGLSLTMAEGCVSFDGGNSVQIIDADLSLPGLRITRINQNSNFGGTRTDLPWFKIEL